MKRRLVLAVAAMAMLANAGAADEANCTRVPVAMIYTKGHPRTQAYVSRFLEAVFATAADDVELLLLPPSFTEACDGDTQPVGSAVYDKGRGSNVAHIASWATFVRARRGCTDKVALIVFEYDAFVGSLDAGRLALQAARAPTADLHYLGYCYHKPHHDPHVSHVAPYCLHAYVVTLTGARRLLHDVDPCGPFADVQLARLADSGAVTWSYGGRPYDPVWVSSYFRDEGASMSGFFHYGGPFVQAKLDRPLAPAAMAMPVFLCTVAGRGREVYVFSAANRSWSLVPSLEALKKLRPHGEDPRVVPVSEWQMRAYPVDYS